MNMNWLGAVLSMNILLMRGEPRLPKVLYSPRNPLVKIEFMYMCDIVSGSAAILSPNRSSTVHTLSPLGISLLPDARESLRVLRPVYIRLCR